MTENVPEADPKYVEVAEEYEEDVLIASVPEAFTNFSMSGSYPTQAPMHKFWGERFTPSDIVLIRNKTYFY